MLGSWAESGHSIFLQETSTIVYLTRALEFELFYIGFSSRIFWAEKFTHVDQLVFHFLLLSVLLIWLLSHSFILAQQHFFFTRGMDAKRRIRFNCVCDANNSWNFKLDIFEIVTQKKWNTFFLSKLIFFLLLSGLSLSQFHHIYLYSKRVPGQIWFFAHLKCKRIQSTMVLHKH